MSVPKFMMKLSAKLMAYMMYKPFGPVRPSKKMVIDRTMKDTGFDLAGFQTWEKEYLDLENGDIHIPATYFPIPEPKGVAILAHGYGQNRYVLIPQAEIFRELGYSVVMFDQRHFGVSKAPNGTFSVKEASDLITLVDWVKKTCGKNTKIVVLGVSMGAMTVMNAISQTDHIDAAIEDCGPSRLTDVYDTLSEVLFGYRNPYFADAVNKAAARNGVSAEKTRPIDSVAKSDVPLLVIHSEGDKSVPVKLALEIRAASQNPLSRAKIFGAYGHAFSVNDRALYKSSVESFLNDVFRGGEEK